MSGWGDLAVTYFKVVYYCVIFSALLNCDGALAEGCSSEGEFS